MLERIKFQLKKLLLKLKIVKGNNPSFFIIGAQKAGTTSLFNYIKEYADNFVSPRKKELYFFTEFYSKGINWYKANFPLRMKPGDITGEATPDYLFFPFAAKRMVEHYPHAKIIVMLRNPIDRAYSQYNFQNNTNKTRAYDPLPFKKALLKEDERLRKEQKAVENGELTYVYKYFSYIHRGFYSDQLKNLYCYYPKEQVMIIESNQLFQNTDDTLKQVFDFLGLRSNGVKREYKAYNETHKENLPEDAKELLRSIFKEKNEELFVLLDKRFDWDKEG